MIINPFKTITAAHVLRQIAMQIKHAPILYNKVLSIYIKGWGLQVFSNSCQQL